MRKTQAEEGDGEGKSIKAVDRSWFRSTAALSLSSRPRPRPPRLTLPPPRHANTPTSKKTAIGRVCEKCELVNQQKKEKERVTEEEQQYSPSDPSIPKKKNPNLRRRQVRRLRLVRAPRYARPHLRRVQLRQPVRSLRRLWGLWRGGRLLLPGVHAAGEGREEEEVFFFCSFHFVL